MKRANKVLFILGRKSKNSVKYWYYLRNLYKNCLCFSLKGKRDKSKNKTTFFLTFHLWFLGICLIGELHVGENNRAKMTMALEKAFSVLKTFLLSLIYFEGGRETGLYLSYLSIGKEWKLVWNSSSFSKHH